jgi:hypothetical protein
LSATAASSSANCSRMGASRSGGTTVNKSINADCNHLMTCDKFAPVCRISSKASRTKPSQVMWPTVRRRTPS